MLAFIIRRVFQAVFVFLAISILSFAIFKNLGDPINSMLGQEATLEDRAAMAERLGLNDPLIVQFTDYLGRVAEGELGVSYRLGEPVGRLILERLPATLELAFTSAVFAFVFGIIFGVYTAVRRYGFVPNIVMIISLIGVSLPTFLIGVGLIFFVAVGLNFGSSFGRGEVGEIFGIETALATSDGLSSLVLPAITLGLYQMTLIMRLVRAEMLEVMRQDYIRFARARGLSERAITFGHALKNTMIPVITVAGLQLGSIIAFAIVTEFVFQWPGVGLLFIESIDFVDVPMMAAYLLLIGALFVTINLIVDLLYLVIDPRLRADRGRA